MCNLFFRRPKSIENMFMSEEESSAGEFEKKPTEKKTKKRVKKSPPPEASGSRVRASGNGSGADNKRFKSNKSTAKELFGSDSEEDNVEEIGKKESTLVSYITKRNKNGYSRRVNALKSGTHFVEIKIYKSDEIEKVSPMNRWRHAIIAIKNKSETNTEAWQHLSTYLAAVRKEFKDCPAMTYNSYN